MGQYYIVVNVDKKEYMSSQGGSKLMEWSYNRNPLVLNLLKKLANEWKGDNVFVVGDYAVSKDRIDKSKEIIEKDYDYDVLDTIEKNLGINDMKIGGYDVSLYGFAQDNFKEIKLEDIKEEYKYIYNHKRKEYIDLQHCPLAWLYKEKNKYYEVKIAPISLLLALGNGMGGGDYAGNNYNMVGKYIKDVNELEITKEPLNVNYKEFRPEFYEDDYIPYSEIENEINLNKEKIKLVKEIVDFISAYNSENFKLCYKDIKNAISRIEFSLDRETDRRKKEIINIIENNNLQEIKNKGNELIERIDKYKFERITRSNKSKSDIELKDELDEDKFISETYKRIFEELKLNNIENISTIDKETTIVFDTGELSVIKTKNKDEIKDYIENTKIVDKMSKEQKEVIKYSEFDERIEKKNRNPEYFYYEYREVNNEKVIENGAWVDFAGTLVTNKDILKDKEFIDYNELFDNPKIMLLDDSDIQEKAIIEIRNEQENEEEEI